MRFNLDVCFTDSDRGIDYQATAHGSAWHETPARGPSYSSGGEPGEPAGCEVERIAIESMFVDSKQCGSKVALELKPNIDDPCYLVWCDEILEDCSDAIHNAVMDKLADIDADRQEDVSDEDIERFRNRNRYSESDDAA